MTWHLTSGHVIIFTARCGLTAKPGGVSLRILRVLAWLRALLVISLVISWVVAAAVPTVSAVGSVLLTPTKGERAAAARRSCHTRRRCIGHKVATVLVVARGKSVG